MSSRPAANRMTLGVFKARLTGAKKGHGLLKKKRDALKSRFQQMLKDIVVTKKGVVSGISDCSFSMAKSQWATGSITSTVIEKVKTPSALLKGASENVAGVYLPVFQLQQSEISTFDMIGAGSGGQVVQTTRQQHMTTLELLVKMASLQTSFLTLDNAIKATSRRVNALEYVVIPRVEDVIEYIKSEMDEMEREEFFRVKKVVNNKRKKIEEEYLANEKEAAARAAASSMPASALQEKDPDLLF